MLFSNVAMDIEVLKLKSDVTFPGCLTPQEVCNNIRNE